MESFIIRALQLILSLSILIIVHEFGHYLFARIFKIRVEKFYLFFDAGFALFRFKPKKSDTEYGIGWLPLGGYVKISGMIDESMDKKQMAKPAEKWEFRSKPAWQRFFVMIGGVLFNMLLAFFIYSMVLFTCNDEYLPLKSASQGMIFSDSAKSIGFKDGDILLRTDDKELKSFGLDMILSISKSSKVYVLRQGKETTIDIPKDFMKRLMVKKDGFANFSLPLIVNGVLDNSLAQKAQLAKGDSIVSINNNYVSSINQLQNQLSNNIGKTISLKYYRNNVSNIVDIPIDSTGIIGVIGVGEKDYYKSQIVVHKYSFFGSFVGGVKKGILELKNYIYQFKYVFTKEGASSIGGFASIGKLFSVSWDWLSFWMMTAFLSVMLAFMNILPIPALDGGHIMFVLYEMISGRKPSEKFLEYSQIVGMVILFGLLIYANGMDIFRAIFK